MKPRVAFALRGSRRPPEASGSRAPAPKVAALAAVLLVLVAIGGVLQVRVDTTIRSFLPAGDSSFKALEKRAHGFGDEPVVVLLESNGAQELIRDQNKLLGVLGLEGALSQLPDVASVYGPATVLNQVAKSAQNLLAEIVGRRDALQQAAEIAARRAGADAQAIEAARNAAVRDFDRRYGALLVQGLPAGLPTLKNERFVATVLYDENQSVRPQWRFVVPNDHSVALLVRPREGLDQVKTQLLVDAINKTVEDAGLDVHRVTVSGVPVVMAGMTKRAQTELPLLGLVAVAAVGLVFLVAPWGRRRRRLAPLVAALAGAALTVGAFGWLERPLSLGVVAFLPILMGIGSDFPYYMLTHGRRRKALIAAAAGFGSLLLSPLPFVRELGASLAIGVVATAACALVLRALLPTPDADGSGSVAEPSAGTWTRPQWAVIAAVATLAAALGWIALPSLDIEGRPERLASGLEELKDAEHVEQVLGSSGELSVLLIGDNAFSPEALHWAKQAEDSIIRRHGDDLRTVVSQSSLFGFLGDKPTPGQVESGLSLMPAYLTKAVVKSDRTASLMTFGVRLNDLESQRSLVQDIRAQLPTPPAGLEAEVVGIPVVVARGIDLASGGRAWLNLAGALAASLVIGIGLGRAQGLRVAATILLSIGWMWGLAWIFVGSLNPLTVAIGSLTTATACEFTVMLSRSSTSSRRDWVVVGTAAIAAVAGYSTLALSELSVLREFGLLLASGVALSFLAALIVTRIPKHPAEAAGARSEQATAPEGALL